MRRQRLTPRDWTRVMLPEADIPKGRIHLRVDGASRQEHLLNTPRRWGTLRGRLRLPEVAWGRRGSVTPRFHDHRSRIAAHCHEGAIAARNEASVLTGLDV